MIFSAIMITILLLGLFSYLLIRFPKNKAIPRQTRIRRIIIFWILFFIVLTCMFLSNLFWGTTNPFAGAYSIFTVKVLGAEYSETYSEKNDFAQSLEKVYIIAPHYDKAILERVVSTAYSETNLLMTTFSVQIDNTNSKIKLFYIDNERGQCGTGVITEHGTYAVLEVSLNLY